MPDNDDRLIFLVFTAQHVLRKYLQEEFRKEKILITPSHTGRFILSNKEWAAVNECFKQIAIHKKLNSNWSD